MRIRKDSSTIEEKLPLQVKRGDGSYVRGKNREEWDKVSMPEQEVTKMNTLVGTFPMGLRYTLKLVYVISLDIFIIYILIFVCFFHFLFQVEANVFFVSCCAHLRFILCLIISWPSTLSVPNNTIGLGAIIDSLESARPIVFQAYETILRGYARAM